MESLPLAAPSKNALFWILQAGGWAVFGAVMLAWGLGRWAPADAVCNKVLLVATGVPITLLARALYRRISTQGAGPALSIVVAFGFSFAAAAVWIEAVAIPFNFYWRAAHGGALAFRPDTILFGNLMFFALVLLVWSLLYFGVNAWIELESERRRSLAAETMARTARLTALQAQLEPHFLFNTLNTVSTLVSEGKASAARQALARLASLLRYTLDTADRLEIRLAEEIEFVRAYVDIQQTRFGARLAVTFDVDPAALDALVPPLVLQPLVENAVKHAVLPREAGGAVVVQAELADGRLRLAVSDDGPGCAAVPLPGHGLANLRARLEALYGDGAALSVSGADAGCTAAVTLPAAGTPRREAAE